MALPDPDGLDAPSLSELRGLVFGLIGQVRALSEENRGLRDEVAKLNGTDSQAGHDVAISPSDLLIGDTGRPYADGTPRAYREARVYVGRAHFEARVGRPSELGGLRLVRDARLVELFIGYLAAYVEAVPGISSTESESELDGLLQLLADLVGERTAAGIASAEPFTLAGIRDLADVLIARCLGRPDLDVATLVRNLGVSRTQPYAALTECGGIRASRLDHVRAPPTRRQRDDRRDRLRRGFSR